MKIDAIYADIIAMLSVGVTIRTIVSLYSYSGDGKPPMYGDYEAQRHWQEITTNVKAIDWYRNTTENDLLYWGLDYPPVTAYHSYILGIIARDFNKSFVELGESRGIESAAHKNFMRWTVLLADILLYLPAITILYSALLKHSKKSLLLYMLPMVFYPGQILIDNGHFQYNNISLGLYLLALAAILKDRYYLGSFLYTLALNYKQMELYHALPCFIYLLRTCYDQKRFLSKFKTFTFISGTVLATFLIIWLPWLGSVKSVLEVLGRLFPIGRGVFEDKVANFWCALNVGYKVKNKLQNQQMAILCLSVTAAFVLPINIHLFFNKRKQTFLLSLVNTAMAFYLFSFQVHEKSILLVAIPALCLFNIYPLETLWFLEATVFSMFPLYVKDGLVIPFFALFFIYHIGIKHILLKEHNLGYKSNFLSAIASVSMLSMFFIAFVSLHASPPRRYPFMWPLIICLLSFAHFFLYFGFCISQQISGGFNIKIKST